MIKKIKQFRSALVISFLVLAPSLGAAFPVQVSANYVQSICDGTNYALGNAAGGDCKNPSASNDEALKSLATKIVNVFSVIVGVVAVIMIIYGGFRYITSGGDSGNVGNAKNTLIYAIVGLVIVAFAQFIVHYVLQAAINTSAVPT